MPLQSPSQTRVGYARLRSPFAITGPNPMIHCPNPLLTYTSEAIEHFCRTPGQGCYKVKRAAEAITEALAEPEADADPDVSAIQHFCRTPGQSCYKAKRAAEALAKVAADAAADL